MKKWDCPEHPVVEAGPGNCSRRARRHGRLAVRHLSELEVQFYKCRKFWVFVWHVRRGGGDSRHVLCGALATSWITSSERMEVNFWLEVVIVEIRSTVRVSWLHCTVAIVGHDRN